MRTIAPILEAASDHPYISLASVVLGFAALIPLTRRRRSDLPPGPKGYPIIGNLFDVPPTHVWEKFGEFGKQYGALPVFGRHTLCNLVRTYTHTFTRTGEVTYLNILGQETIILNSYKAAVDMFDKKSSTYSNRPIFMMCGEIAGWNKTLALVQYGPRFRAFRKYMSKAMGTRASVEKFAPLQEKETAKFVAKIMADPDSLAQQIQK